ncbi:MAG: SRPBCC domain-containing protein [Candidatus Thorarchaeota archaeon]|nr:SRPBCC domain-containing protein [Candidatus Thorarchaeota archaeon]
MTELIDVEIKQSTLVRAEPEKVYDALTTGEGLDAWFTVGSEVDARSGGSIKFSWKDWGPDKYTMVSRGPVLEAKRPERFVFQWYSDDPSYATTIEINFEAVEEGTVVRLREYGYHDTPSGRAALLECAAGWGEAITLMKFYVEHGIVY